MPVRRNSACRGPIRARLDNDRNLSHHQKPFGLISSHTSPPQFKATVAQNAFWNDCLLDLCRRYFCATSAPGQPPSKLNKCNALSVVRQRLSLAEDLSQPYTMKVIPLLTEYIQKTKAGSFPAMTMTDTKTRNVVANSNDIAPGLREETPGARSPANVTLAPCRRPFGSRLSSYVTNSSPTGRRCRFVNDLI